MTGIQVKVAVLLLVLAGGVVMKVTHPGGGATTVQL